MLVQIRLQEAKTVHVYIHVFFPLSEGIPARNQQLLLGGRVLEDRVGERQHIWWKAVGEDHELHMEEFAGPHMITRGAQKIQS